MTEEKIRTEEYQVTGELLVAKIKELIHEGNIRRITIKNEEGKPSDMGPEFSERVLAETAGNRAILQRN